LLLLDRISNKRDSLARGLGALGLIALLEKRARRRLALAVLTYHRIAEPGVGSDPYYDPVISATPRSFEAEMAFLRRFFEPVSLERLLEPDLVRSTIARSGRPPIAVTFDDGYRDNFEAALPVLHRLEIPAAFFIPTRFLEQPELPWWDHVAYVLKRTRAERLMLRRSPEDAAPTAVALGPSPDDPTRVEAIWKVVRLFLEHAIPDAQWFLDQLQEQADVAVDSRSLGAALFMGWSELHALLRAGMTVGSHGHAHEALGRLDRDAQRDDLGKSRRILEAGLGREVVAVAYPYGWPGAFTPETCRLAEEAGYRLGFTALEGVNRPEAEDHNPLCLRRLNVGTGDSGPLLRARAALHGAFGRSFL
jgi:peptidoglycan/xylan/chitin deacetylase (PgdA/CDA1 family)